MLAHGAQLPAPFPYSGHRFPKFFVRDVQVTLRLFDVGVAEHSLDRADVHSIAEEPAGALVMEVVPTQIDQPEPLAIDARTAICSASAREQLRHSTVQELLGHADVSMTMIYTYVLNRGALGVRSPADRL